MKNLRVLSIIIFTILCLNLSTAFAQNGVDFSGPRADNLKEQRRIQFEQRLKLTDKQKIKAKELHNASKEEMKPIILKLQMKRQELDSLSLLKLPDNEYKLREENLKKDIKELEKQSNEIRKRNIQEFEKILNKSQKTELEKMKAEGRERFERMHQANPMFQGLGAPNMLFRPMINRP